MALDIKWERPDQRLSLSVTAPLFVDLGQQRLKASEWSLEGFRLTAPRIAIDRTNQRQTLHLTLPFQGFEMGFDAVCDLALDPADADILVAHFVELGHRERELMAHFVEELLRGSMVPVRDTIQRIDVPVMPARLTPDSPPADLPSRLRRGRRSIGMTAFYGLLGAAIFGYLGLMIYGHLFHMEVQSAMISSPVEMVAAQAEGHVTWGQFKPGDAVKSGDVVVRLFDNALEREIEIAEIAIREREARHVFLRRRERNGVERLQSMPVVELRQLTRTKLDLDDLRAQLTAAEQELQKPQPVASQAAASPQDAPPNDPLKVRIADLKSRIDAKEFDLRTRKDTINRTSTGRKPLAGTLPAPQLVGSLDDLEAQIELSRQEIQFARERHAALLNQRERLVVRAPFDGRLTDLPHVDKGSIRKGDIVAILEQSEPRQVTAYLNDDELARIRLGDRARLYVPAARETLAARVSRIDRGGSSTGREFDPQSGSPGRWRTPAGHGGKVILSFEDASKIANAETFRPGLPVVVVFEAGNASQAARIDPRNLSRASEMVEAKHSAPRRPTQTAMDDAAKAADQARAIVTQR